ncbi:MAG: hypothetical protein FE834_10665, partial [Gammaproteobacteria bacterium]|nr:hypothetical protein [Gammaproteobacteria bacterium]
KKAQITININNININNIIKSNPLMIQDQTRDIQESADINTNIGAVLTTQGDPTKFEITAGNTDGLFKINATTGQIQVAKTTLDYETAPTGNKYTLRIQISKAGFDAKTATITIRIIDIDETIGFFSSHSSASETNSNQTHNLVVELNAKNNKAVEVTYNIASSSTATNTDYSLPNTHKLTIPAGTLRITLPLTIIGDTLNEADETVVITLSNPLNANLHPNKNTHTHTITNDDAQPIVSFARTHSTNPEADSSKDLSVELNTASGKEVVVNYTVSGTATNADYTLVDGTLTFAPGVTTQDISLQIKADNIDEEDETVIVTLADDSNLKNATLDTDNTHTHTITDDDTRGLSLSIDQLSVPELGSRAYAFKLDTQPTGNVTITPVIIARDIIGIPTAVNAATIQPSKITFTKDDWNLEHTFTVTGKDDDNASNEVFDIGHIVTGADYDHYSDHSTNDSIDLDDTNVTSTTNIVAITMRDNDIRSITPSLTTLTVSEISSKTYTLTLKTEPTGDVTITPVSGNSSAIVSGPIIFTKKNWNERQTITVTGVPDIDNINEHFNISHTVKGADYESNNISVPDVTITMEDNTGTINSTLSIISFEANTSHSTEADSTQTLVVRLNKNSSEKINIQPITVDYAVTGTATNPEDYAAPNNGTLTFNLGETEKSIRFNIKADLIDEDDETVVVTLSNAKNASLKSNNEIHTHTITDDDISTISFDTDKSEGSESVSSTNLGITLSTPNAQDIKIDYTVTGTATAPDDYTATSGTLTINAGDTQGSISITGIVDDFIDELDKTIIVTLSTTSNGILDGDKNKHTYTITDDDISTISFVTDKSEGSESVSSANLGIALSTPNAQDIKIDYTVTGTATAPDDYTATSGTLTINAGDTQGSISITGIVDDLIDELDKTIIVTLSTTSNGILDGDKNKHTYTITDDDISTISFVTDKSEGSESVSSANLGVKLSNPNTQDININYTVTGTATAPDDYTATSGTLTINAGDTQGSISITGIVDDNIDEPDNKTIIVTLSTTNKGILDGDKNQHTYTITDDDISTISFDADNSEGFESVSSANLGIALSTPNAQDIKIDYTVTGTATAPDDYTAPSGTLTIKAGATKGNI